MISENGGKAASHSSAAVYVFREICAGREVIKENQRLGISHPELPQIDSIPFLREVENGFKTG